MGDRVAASAQPVSERDGTVVVECSDPVWAEELDMMQADLMQRLRDRLGDQAPSSLRFHPKKV